MYFKLVDNANIINSANVRFTWNGDLTSNLTRWLEMQTPEARAEHGWRDEVIHHPNEFEYASAVYEDDGTYIHVRWVEKPAPPARVYQLSKIAIRKWMRARGLGETFDGLLGADPDIAQDWADAWTLDDNDPKVLAMMAHMVGVGLLTDDDVADLKLTCRSVYQQHGV